MSWYYYPPRKKMVVKDGIRAQSKRGDFGDSWWAKRWNQTLGEYNMGERLGRGRSYARNGRIKSINIQKGLVTAVVYGSSKYKVRISIDMIPTQTWEIITKKIFSTPVIAAKLLAGEMHEDMEEIFTKSGVRLFPKLNNIETDCTCPDWANPCKHIAAVYLILGEEFDRDPFLLFKMRGMEREEMLKMAGLQDMSPNKNAKKDKKSKEPEFIELDGFWGSHAKMAEPEVESIPAVHAALVKNLGSFPFWRSEENFIESMESIYQKASELGIRALAGDPSENDQGQ